jgi:hypothetical protein
MIKKIVSGGQSGADRAALDVAIKFGILHGGWIPKGRITEEGPLPERETTGSHAAVLTANPLGADIAGFHHNGPIKGRLDSQLMGALNHLPACRINGRGIGISQFLCCDIFSQFVFRHFVLLKLLRFYWKKLE